MLKLTKTMVAMSLIVLTAAACGKQEEKKPEAAGSSEPVKIRVYQKIAGISDQEFQRYFVEPVKKKYPNVTLEIVRGGDKGNSEEELLASNSFPDIIYGSNPGIPSFITLGLADDLTEMVKKNNLDLNQFVPRAIETIKQNGKNGELNALPFSQNFGTLIYNKDIFDKFGVPYPKDGMSWEETIELSKKLTRNMDGVQYIGLDPYTVDKVGSGLQLPYVDPKTNKSSINNEGWAKVLGMYKQLFDIPGYIDSTNNKYQYGVNGFFKDRNVAMLAPWLDTVVSQANTIKDFKWDLAQLPNFKEAVGTGREFDEHVVMLSKVSKQKDWAFKVMQLVTTSEEVQTDMTKQGKMSVLNKPELQKLFAANHESFKDKNIGAIFKSKPGLPHIPTLYDPIVTSKLNQTLKDLATTSKDVNTVLRETEEAANKAIDTAKNK
ncbi:extracellular solute-binding protein [Paenibacillus filicis]|uniref:Extracellular solute-binding protein n=1 Tax=Paenibacillus gyeongsangnamensis TaxID=3388067 RepID=A0ABT4QJ28_9BACL|nr:extracellular solute-binding protein [Paenibacillus filicis]MCZ8516886.1 extracellular solute-binding protein [Paenibacillus filicis]